ncbi:MAG: hypothetical protein DRJ40_06335 [Thermoprotei archaeon]|nr:MAG: hypothetical protein DRJ40_06335 [Thermoprotei archaeon]
MVGDCMRVKVLSIVVLVLVLLCIAPSVVYGEEVLKVKDAYGEVVEIKVPVKSIVTLAPGIAEAIWFLGAEDELVGVTRFCNWPSELVELIKVGEVKVIGGIVDPNIEEIIALKPDLVIATTMTPRDVVAKLRELGVKVLVLPHPTSIEDIVDQIRLIARITGRVEYGNKLCGVLEKLCGVLSNVTSERPRVRVYFELWYGPIWTVGGANYMNDVIELAGGVNIFGDTNTAYVSTSDEEVIKRNPEVIVLCRGMGYRFTPRDVVERPGWGNIDAVKGLRVYVLEGPALDALYRYPSPRVVLAALYLLAYFHPELTCDVYARLIRELVGATFNATVLGEKVTSLRQEVERIKEVYSGKVSELEKQLGELRTRLEKEVKIREELQKEAQFWQLLAIVMVVVLVLLVVVALARRRRS